MLLLRRTLDGLGRQQTRVDLAQGDRERLLVDVGVHQRTDVLKQALTELRVVRVDLAGPLGRVDHEAVLRVRGLEELVDRRVDDALGRGDGRGHALPPDGWEKTRHNHTTSIKASSSRATSSTEVLTRVTSNSGSAASSTLAASRRRSITWGGSVPRPVSLRTSSSQEGGARNTSWASGMDSRTRRAPWRSISRRTGTPASRCSSTAWRGVP